MKKLRRFIAVCFALVLGATAFAAAPQAGQANQVNFGKADNVLDLKPALSPYRAPGGTAAASSSSSA